MVKELVEGLKVIIKEKKFSENFQAVHSTPTDAQSEKSEYHVNKPDFTENFKPSSLVAKRKLTSSTLSTQPDFIENFKPSSLVAKRRRTSSSLTTQNTVMSDMSVPQAPAPARPPKPRSTPILKTPVSSQNTHGLPNLNSYHQPILSARNLPTDTLTSE